MPTTFEGMMAQAEILVRSGLLPVEIKTAAAAVAVMLTGRELGLGPMQSLRSIYIVKGKPSLSAQLMAALILRDGHAYKIIESTNSRCEIAFVRRGGQTYVHEFTVEDAKRAGLSQSQTWQAYTKAMLWSRCMSAGARAAMPDVLAGMYTPEELADPDTVIVGEGGEVIDVVSRVVEEPAANNKAEHVPPPEPDSEPESEPERAHEPLPSRPYPAEVIRKALQKAAVKGRTPGPATDHQQQAVRIGLDKLFPHDDATTRLHKRHSVTQYVFGTETTKALTFGQASVLIDWATISEEGADGLTYYNPTQFGPGEAALIVAAYEAERGQLAMEVPV